MKITDLLGFFGRIGLVFIIFELFALLKGNGNPNMIDYIAIIVAIIFYTIWGSK